VAGHRDNTNTNNNSNEKTQGKTNKNKEKKTNYGYLHELPKITLCLQTAFIGETHLAEGCSAWNSK
jgi:hypothetical protein